MDSWRTRRSCALSGDLLCSGSKWTGCVCLLLLFALTLMGPATPRVLTVYAQEPGTGWAIPWDITGTNVTDGVHQYCTLLVDGQQNVHLLWVHNMTGSDETSEGSGAALFYRTDIQGDWSPSVDVVAISGHVMADLSAAISPVNDTIHVFWHDQYIGGDLYHARVWLRDAGNPRAWSSPSLVGTNVGGTCAIDAEGVLHTVLYDAPEAEQQASNVYYARSEDDGKTWSDPIPVYQAITPVPASVSGEIAVDPAGRIHIGITIRSLEYSEYSELGYIRSEDGGKSWTPYEQVAFEGTGWQGVNRIKVFAFSTDEIHRTWHDPRRMHQWSHDGGATWSHPVEIIDLGAAFGGANQLVKDSAGRLYAVTATGGGVYVSTWDKDRWRLFAQVEDRFIDPHGQYIAASQGNRLHVAYYDRTYLGKVWYSSCQISAPGIPRQPYPTRTLDPTAAPTVVPDLSTARETPSPADANYHLRAGEAHLADATRPLIWAVFPVLLLVGGALLLRRR